jgi:glycine/D-amino acid oxidase-like deaminating enzyme
MEMRMYTRDLYSTILPQETGLQTGFMNVGFIELACDENRLHYFRRVAAFNRHCGINVQEISPDEVKERFPLANTDGVLAGFHVPEDGRLNPADATMALAKGARQHGVHILEGLAVKKVTTSSSVATGKPRQATGVIVQETNNCDDDKNLDYKSQCPCELLRYVGPLALQVAVDVLLVHFSGGKHDFVYWCSESSPPA